LPLAERFDAYLLGTGLPSFWVAHLGEMKLTLGLSGWTTNDWTRGSALDLLAPPAGISESLLNSVARLLKEKGSMSLQEICNAVPTQAATAVAALRRLAFSGQVIHDLPNGVYRYRQVMPMPLGEEQLGPENEELSEARHLLLKADPVVESRERLERGVVLAGNVEGTPVEIMVDLDGRIRRGKCVCGHFRRFGIRNGPCRHMIALRHAATEAATAVKQSANGIASRN
jgi:hypothetical protein